YRRQTAAKPLRLEEGLLGRLNLSAGPGLLDSALSKLAASLQPFEQGGRNVLALRIPHLFFFDVVEGGQELNDLRIGHAFSLQVENAPLLEAVLREPHRSANVEKQLINVVASLLRTHRVVGPAESGALNPVFFLLLPNRRDRIRVP